MRPLPKPSATPAPPSSNPFGIKLKPVNRTAPGPVRSGSTAPIKKTELNGLQRSTTSANKDDFKTSGDRKSAISRSASSAPSSRVQKPLKPTPEETKEMSLKESGSCNGDPKDKSNLQNGTFQNGQKVELNGDISPLKVNGVQQNGGHQSVSEHNPLQHSQRDSESNGFSKPPSPPKVTAVKRTPTSILKTEATVKRTPSNHIKGTEPVVKRTPSDVTKNAGQAVRRSPSATRENGHSASSTREASSLTKSSVDSTIVKPSSFTRRSPSVGREVSSLRKSIEQGSNNTRRSPSVSKENGAVEQPSFLSRRPSITEETRNQTVRRSPSVSRENVTERPTSNSRRSSYDNGPLKQTVRRSPSVSRENVPAERPSSNSRRSSFDNGPLKQTVRRSPSVSHENVPAERTSSSSRHSSFDNGPLKQTVRRSPSALSDTKVADNPLKSHTSHSKCLESGVAQKVSPCLENGVVKLKTSSQTSPSESTFGEPKTSPSENGVGKSKVLSPESGVVKTKTSQSESGVVKLETVLSESRVVETEASSLKSGKIKTNTAPSEITVAKSKTSPSENGVAKSPSPENMVNKSKTSSSGNPVVKPKTPSSENGVVRGNSSDPDPTPPPRRKSEKSEATKKLHSKYLSSESKQSVPKAAHLRSESKDLYKPENKTKSLDTYSENITPPSKAAVTNGMHCNINSTNDNISIMNAIPNPSGTRGNCSETYDTEVIDAAVIPTSDKPLRVSIKNKFAALPSRTEELQIEILDGEGMPGKLATSGNNSSNCIPANCSEVLTPTDLPSVSSLDDGGKFENFDSLPVGESGTNITSFPSRKNGGKFETFNFDEPVPSTSKSGCEFESRSEEIRRKIAAINKPSKLLKKRSNSDEEKSASLSLAMSPFLTSGFYSESLSQSVSARIPKSLRSKSKCAPPSDEESVVISAGMSFLLGARKRPVGVKHHFSAAPAHEHDKTQSSKLTKSVKEFLQRTDHVMAEWKELGVEKKRSKSVTAFGETFYDPDDESEGRAKSERRFSWREWKKHRSSSSEEFKSATEDVGSDLPSEDEVSELTADLAEEHSTAVLATERLEAETSERLKLEKDVKELHTKLTSMTQDHERLEFEVLCSRASHLATDSANSDDMDPEVSVYRQKLDRCTRDLEFMKEKLKSQHEDDLDQMVTIKKQLEKKLADAYEEVDEQRQVAAQWKRKAQRLGQEANDTKLLMDEHSTRNAVLEKKQRKFDSEMQIIQDELRQDRSLKERIQREREQAVVEKEFVERELQSVHLELEMRGERISALQREVEALSSDGKSDTESTVLRRAKLELENKVKDQEEELDDLAGQVQLLESAKVRLELQLENLRKDYKRELASKDEEVEEIRCSAQKKVKAIEAQLESEHDERTTVVREKHELERRVLEMTSLLSQSTNDEVVHKLKKDLKKSKALLKDAQLQLEQAKSDTPSKVLLRQLRNQLEDAEFARTAAAKGRQHAEQELADVQLQYEELQRFRNDAEDKYLHVSREKGNIQTQLDDLEAEMAEVMRKYKSTVQQLSIDQLTIQDQASQIASLEMEKQALKESLAELSVKIENIEGDAVTTHAQKRLELKIKELESKAELEHTSRQRLETQVLRHRESVEKSAVDLENCRTKEQVAQDAVRRLQRQIRDLREELSGVSQRDTDASQKVREFEQSIDLLEAENEALKRDLNIALRRIDDLQSAMQGDSESPDSDAQLSDSDSDDSMATVDTLLSSRRPLATSSQSHLPSTSRRRNSRSPSPEAL